MRLASLRNEGSPPPVSHALSLDDRMSAFRVTATDGMARFDLF